MRIVLVVEQSNECSRNEGVEQMVKTLQRSEEEFLESYQQHVDMIWHICMSYMKNHEDTEDIVQETFVKLYTYPNTFDSQEHKKAWLIVTSTNLCKDRLKHWWKKKRVSYEKTEFAKEGKEMKVDTTLQAVMQLPGKYRLIIYLYYYQGYDSAEIANLLHKNKSTIRNQLCRARELLKSMIGEIE